MSTHLKKYHKFKANLSKPFFNFTKLKILQTFSQNYLKKSLQKERKFLPKFIQKQKQRRNSYQTITNFEKFIEEVSLQKKWLMETSEALSTSRCQYDYSLQIGLQLRHLQFND